MLFTIIYILFSYLVHYSKHLIIYTHLIFIEILYFNYLRSSFDTTGLEFGFGVGPF